MHEDQITYSPNFASEEIPSAGWHTKKWPFFIIALIILGTFFYSFRYNRVSEIFQSNVPIGVEEDGWQAVFLTNSQVYFGKLRKAGELYKLSNIYYLQSEQQGNQGQQQLPSSQSDIRLIKFGDELHGPQDEMFIGQDQVLFWENLKETSTVVKSIKDFEKKSTDTNIKEIEVN